MDSKLYRLGLDFRRVGDSRGPDKECVVPVLLSRRSEERGRQRGDRT